VSEQTIDAPKRRGRPLVSDTRADRQLLIRVTPRQRADLRHVAAAEGKGVSTLVRDAVDEYVSDFRERRVFSK